jgi:hypothetical protein
MHACNDRKRSAVVVPRVFVRDLASLGASDPSGFDQRAVNPGVLLPEQTALVSLSGEY